MTHKIIILKDKKTNWLIAIATIIAFVNSNNQEIYAQESVKIDLTDNKTINNSITTKTRKGTKNFIGIVFDENNNPMPGASICIKSIDGQINADSNGEFSILAKKDDILVFSYVGYENVELQLKKDDSLLKIYLNNKMATTEVIKIKFKKE
jgi:hypothetical protein